MIYIYDILLNWSSDGVYEFFEWDVNDELEHVKKIPLQRVSSEILKVFFFEKVKVDTSFLTKIKKKTECYFHNGVDIVSYATLFSDGKRCLALEFNEQGDVLYKSTLLLDEEEEVLEMTEELVITPITYEVLQKEKEITCLTRKEIADKNYLLKELAKIEKEEEKINYLYEEYFEDEQTDAEKYQQLQKKIIKEEGSVLEELKSFFATLSRHHT